MNLSAYQWKNRLLLIFARSASDRDHEEQLRLLEGLEPDFEERDLLLGQFFDCESGELDGTPVSTGETAKLRAKFVLEGFAMILIGKDGGEKFGTEKPVSAEEIFCRIDAMPIRRREIRERR